MVRMRAGNDHLRGCAHLQDSGNSGERQSMLRPTERIPLSLLPYKRDTKGRGNTFLRTRRNGMWDFYVILKGKNTASNRPCCHFCLCIANNRRYLCTQSTIGRLYQLACDVFAREDIQVKQKHCLTLKTN